jgi:serine/threonine protein kinase/tetratricopeptide (TPR) repeat protein
MAIDPGRVKALFQAAIEQANPEERQAFLDREAGDNAELRARLDALLAVYDQPPGVLDRPLDADLQATAEMPGATGRVATMPVPTDGGEPAGSPRGGAGPSLIDSVIAGRYKIRQEIGEGGMGSVYLAEQLQPVRRMVALKLIKPGMDTRGVLARFESERQALALMDHPHIARVLDAGSTDQGRPYFVMELVKGIPITEYCDRNRLGLAERLALFRQVCSAVQHAHQKGIIHRDLKPSNILVEAHDDRPVPKVIDFGLAKATSGLKLTEQSLFTAFGSVTGTPLYMAPEQARFNALDVDTRADIYALGVVLYELLTGSTPIRRDTIQRAALDEMLRVIREEEPPTPSSRISTSEALPSLAVNRQIEPARLSRLVRGDLDWIVMKALAKERQRRYDSAIGLANDLERFANHEPVSAGPPSSSYRMRKFVRRNRVQVMAAALVLLVLVIGIMGTTLGLVEAMRQERLARQEALARDRARQAEAEQRNIAVAEASEKEKARRAEADQRKQAEESARQATEEAAKARAINEFLTKDLLTQAEPANNAVADKVTLLEVLDRAAAKVGERFADQPEVALTLRRTIGKTYHGLGAWKQAEAQWRAALDAERKANPESAGRYKAQSELAHVLRHLGRSDAETLALAEEASAGLARIVGRDHPDTLTSMNNLALIYEDAGKFDRALPILEETLALRRSKLGADEPQTITTMNNLASVYEDAGKLDLALRVREEALALCRSKLGPDHPDTLTIMVNLALSYQDAGKADSALRLFEEALALQKSKLGPDHPQTITTMNNLALGYKDAGQVDRALPILEQTLALRISKLGPDHPDTLTSMNNLAAGYQEAGKLDSALPILEKALALCQSKLGPEHPDTLTSMNNLAVGYRRAGKLDRALPILEKTLVSRKSKLGPDHPQTLTSMNNLALGYRDAGRLDNALRLFEEALALQKSKLGPDHPQTLTSMNNLGTTYWRLGRLGESIRLFEETLKLREVRSGKDHPDTLRVKANLGMNYKDAGRLGEALPLLEEAYRASDRIPTLTTVASSLLDAYVQTGRADKAVALARVRIPQIRAATPADSPERAGQLAPIGASLLQVKAWAEAEPVLREVLTFREAKEPDAWATFNTKSMVGGALLGQKKDAEAEPLMRAGYDGLKQRAEKIPQQDKVRLAEALDRLIELAEATGKPAEATAWRDEKARLASPTPKPEGESKKK